MSRAARTLTAAFALALAAPLLSGCVSAASPEAPPAVSLETNEESSNAVTLAGGWAKSAKASGMSGVFGTLHNTGAEDLVIAGVTSEVAAHTEIHEVTSSGVMQPISTEVTIPAGGTFEFAPGADHIMLMGLHEELLAGTELRLTVTFTNGSSTELTVAVKDYSGANEEYGGGSEHGSGAEHEADSEHDAEADHGTDDAH